MSPEKTVVEEFIEKTCRLGLVLFGCRDIGKGDFARMEAERLSGSLAFPPGFLAELKGWVLRNRW